MQTTSSPPSTSSEPKRHYHHCGSTHLTALTRGSSIRAPHIMARRASKAVQRSDEEDEDSHKEQAAKRSRKKVVYDDSDDDAASTFGGSLHEDKGSRPSRKSGGAARASTSSVNDAPPAPAQPAKNKRLTTISSPPRTPRHSNGSSNGVPDTAARKRLSVISRPGPLGSAGQPAGTGNGSGQTAATAAQAPRVSMEVMNNNFEEWMKLATDNVGDSITGLYTSLTSTCPDADRKSPPPIPGISL